MAHTERIDGALVLRDDWHVEDILNQGPWLTTEQAEDILDSLADRFDANSGINWDIIDFWIEYTYPCPDNYVESINEN